MLKHLLLVLLSLVPAHKDIETWDERVVRMNTFAVAIDAASEKATCSGQYNTTDCKLLWPRSKKKDLEMALVEQAETESHFAKNVHEGNCEKWECDPRKLLGVIYFKSHSNWQIQAEPPVNRALWAEIVGIDQHATTRAAWAATLVLANGWKHTHSIHGTFGVYAGLGAGWPEGKIREKRWEELMRLTDEQATKLIRLRKTYVVCKTDPMSFECICLKEPDTAGCSEQAVELAYAR